MGLKFKQKELNTSFYKSKYQVYNSNQEAILKQIERMTQNIYLINLLNFLAGLIGLIGGLYFLTTL